MPILSPCQPYLGHERVQHGVRSGVHTNVGHRRHHPGPQTEDVVHRTRCDLHSCFTEIAQRMLSDLSAPHQMRPAQLWYRDCTTMLSESEVNRGANGVVVRGMGGRVATVADTANKQSCKRRHQISCEG